MNIFGIVCVFWLIGALFTFGHTLTGFPVTKNPNRLKLMGFIARLVAWPVVLGFTWSDNK